MMQSGQDFPDLFGHKRRLRVQRDFKAFRPFLPGM
jgi:hypothetical protein